MTDGNTGDTKNTRKVLADWLGDLVAIESHIEEALDHQLKERTGLASVDDAIKQFHDSTKMNRDRVRSFQKTLGEEASKGIIERGAQMLGKAAGVIDQLRKDTVTKSLRDDYTAFNLAAISYTLFYTTATALGDERAASLAQENLKVHAANVQKINQVIGDAAVLEISKDDYPVVNQRAADQTRSMVNDVWSATAQSS